MKDVKIKAIERMVKSERSLVIRQAAGGDVWIGTGACMYNVGALGPQPAVTVRWLFGLSEAELEKLDNDDCGFTVPDEDTRTIDEDGVIGLKIADDRGNAVTPHVFGSVVYMLADGEAAPLAGEKNLAYRFDPEAGRIIVMRGMFPTASISAHPQKAEAPFVKLLGQVLQLIWTQSGMKTGSGGGVESQTL